MTNELQQEIARIGVGDHLCLMYQEPTEAIPPAAHFLRQAIERGGQGIYVVDDQPVEAVRSALAEAGIDVVREESRGALRFLTGHEYCAPGEFEPQRMLARFRALGDEVAAAGFPVVHAAVEMTWALSAGAPLDQLADYECWGNNIFEHVTGASLCLYNQRRFPAAAMERLLRAHPIVVLGEEVAPNPFYEPPEVFFGREENAELRFRWMVKQLERASRDRRERKELADRARSLEAEREARAAAEEMSRAKSHFMAVVSHELRTPLTAIMGYAELLGQQIAGPLTERQSQHLDRIRTSSGHLLKLIEEILDFSRVEAGGIELEPESVDIVQFSREVAGMLAPEARTRGIDLAVDLPPDPVLVDTDPARLRQILFNLLSNAIKFTPQGGVRLEVRVEEASVQFRVVDTGVGIPSGELERIFDAFHQGATGREERRPGAGLGLAVSRSLARAMGGDVTAESAPGEGSTFTLELPRSVTAPLQSA